MKNFKILNSSRFSVHSPREEIIRTLLENRGIKTRKEVEEFLAPNLENVTIETVKIDRKEVKKALNLIEETIREKKAIVIYGDYDVDGICGTAILWETIYSFYENVHPYIPHRVDEGYGLSMKGIKNLKLKIKNCGLIITVDNGIVASKAVDYAKSLGIKTIITDHHTKGSTTPSADATIHTTELCGAGVAHLLAQEIYKSEKFSNEDHLELVALATVADLVPLNKYNRTLLKFGLDKLRKTKRIGLLEMFEEAKIDKEKIGVYEIGHIIAPRLNASGRISHALDSLRLICTTDKSRAKKLALNLGKINRERQELTVNSALDAIERVRGEKARSGSGSEGERGVGNLIFVESESYEQGVIGLIASRLVEEFYRPAIAVSLGKETSKGSARSIKGVNIIELIRSSSNFLSEAGGHPMAAGFSIETVKLESFKEAIIKTSEKIDEKLFERLVTVDLELPFELISPELYEKIQKLEPFGMGNPEPVFMSRNVLVESLKFVGREKNHLKLELRQGGAEIFSAMSFSNPNSGIKEGDIIDIVYLIEQNVWRDKTELVLKIKDTSLYKKS